MILNMKNNFIFVHVPKVAGISITNALSGQMGYQKMWNIRKEMSYFGTHTSAASMKQALGDKSWNSIFTFGFVRNPWDRLYSLYNFMCYSPLVNTKDRRDKTYKHDQGTYQGKGFKWFLMDNKEKTTPIEVVKDPNDLENRDNYICQQITPQMTWLGDKKGNSIVRYIAMFEDIENEFKLVAKRCRINVELPWTNRHTKDDYRKHYDNEMIEFVEHYHKIDIDTFNYEFE